MADIEALLQEQNRLYREAIAVAQAQTQAEQERARLEQANQKNLLNLQNTERQRVKLLFNIEEKLTALLEFVPVMNLTILGIYEWQQEAGHWMDQIDRAMLVLLAKRGNGGQKEADQIAGELRTLSLKRELLQRTRNLNEMREEQAKGGFDLKLTNKIREEEEMIKELQDQLNL